MPCRILSPMKGSLYSEEEMEAYGTQLLTWNLAGSSRVVPLYSVSTLRLSPIEKLRARQCSQMDFFRRSVSNLVSRPLKQMPRNSYISPESSLVLSFEHSSTLDSQPYNSRVPVGFKRGQRLWRGLSSRRGVHLSPNHFRSVPQRKPARALCCLTVEARPLTSHPTQRGAKEDKAVEAKRERRRTERLLLAKTKEMLHTEGSPARNFRLAL